MVRNMYKKALVVVVVIGIIMAIIYIFIKYNTDNSTEDDSPAIVVTERSTEDTMNQENSIKNYELIITAYNNKDYKSVIEQAKTYGELKDNSQTARINAYYLCVRSAFVLGDDIAKIFCFEQAKEMFVSLEEQDRAVWVPIFDAGLEGRNVEEAAGEENENF